MAAILFGAGAIVAAALQYSGTTSSKPYLKELSCNFEDDDSVKRCAAAVAPHLKGAALGDMTVTLVSGGITNKLKKVSGPAGPAVLVRVFGAEGMIDREVENPTFEAISDYFGRPLYYGRFANGRVEGWLEGARPLKSSPNEMADLRLSPLIAAQMAKLHKMQVPANLQQHYQSAGMWEQLWAWYREAAATTTTETIASRAQKEGLGLQPRPAPQMLEELDLGACEAVLRSLQAAIPTTAPVVFSHNDLLCGNIMANETTHEVTLIDFEYGGLNFRGFDIANHFNEWAGGTDNGYPDYKAYPTPAQQRLFCAAYLEEMLGEKASDRAIEALMKEAALFAKANHWYWGLWAVNQARDEGWAAFPYLTYAQERIGRYYVLENGGDSPFDNEGGRPEDK